MSVPAFLLAIPISTCDFSSDPCAHTIREIKEVDKEVEETMGDEGNEGEGKGKRDLAKVSGGVLDALRLDNELTTVLELINILK